MWPQNLWKQNQGKGCVITLLERVSYEIWNLWSGELGRKCYMECELLPHDVMTIKDKGRTEIVHNWIHHRQLSKGVYMTSNWDAVLLLVISGTTNVANMSTQAPRSSLTPCNWKKWWLAVVACQQIRLLSLVTRQGGSMYIVNQQESATCDVPQGTEGVNRLSTPASSTS